MGKRNKRVQRIESPDQWELPLLRPSTTVQLPTSIGQEIVGQDTTIDATINEQIAVTIETLQETLKDETLAPLLTSLNTFTPTLGAGMFTDKGPNRSIKWIEVWAREGLSKLNSAQRLVMDDEICGTAIASGHTQKSELDLALRGYQRFSVIKHWANPPLAPGYPKKTCYQDYNVFSRAAEELAHLKKLFPQHADKLDTVSDTLNTLEEQGQTLTKELKAGHEHLSRNNARISDGTQTAYR